MKFASIDIGSNAVRLLLCNVTEMPNDASFRKAELIRVPIRLGEDAFLYRKISETKTGQLVKTMHAFKLLIEVFGAVEYRACATSAMREAENAGDVIAEVERETGIIIEVIDGKTEAGIIYSNHVAEHLDHTKSYLYIDIGGGSTELTLFSKNKIVTSQSFNVGTLRMLHNQVNKEYWSSFKKWVRDVTALYHPLTAIGSGGNINKLFKMSRRKEDKPLAFDKIKEMDEWLNSLTFEERINILGMKPDRADVIIPALKILLAIMKHGQIEDLIVPQIGLSDGIVHLLYEDYKKRQAAESIYQKW